jgi:hypothetical protein
VLSTLKFKLHPEGYTEINLSEGVGTIGVLQNRKPYEQKHRGKRNCVFEKLEEVKVQRHLSGTNT